MTGSAGWGRVPLPETRIIFNVSLFFRVLHVTPSSSSPRSRPRPSSPGPAFPAPVPPRPTQVAAAGSGCRRLRFPRPPWEPSRASSSGGGKGGGARHSSPSSQRILKATSGVLGGTIRQRGSQGGVEKRKIQKLQEEKVTEYGEKDTLRS
jgi:hypothetical protein